MLVCGNLLGLSSGSSGVSLELIMETWYTWMVCIHEGHSNVNHECKITLVYWLLSWRASSPSMVDFCGFHDVKSINVLRKLSYYLKINDSMPNKYLPLTVPLSGTTGLSFCQLQKQRILVSRYINSSSISYVPQCLDSGAFDAVQCDMELGQCWCVDPEGMEIYGTRQRGKPTRCK